MAILVGADDITSRTGILQKEPEATACEAIAQTSPLTTQAIDLTAAKGDSVAVTEKPGTGNLFDLSLLEEMDDNEYVAEILTIFLGNSPKELYELKRACMSNKFDAVYKMAHKLKGSVGLLQANFLLNVLIRIEETAIAEKMMSLQSWPMWQMKNIKK